MTTSSPSDLFVEFIFSFFLLLLSFIGCFLYLHFKCFVELISCLYHLFPWPLLLATSSPLILILSAYIHDLRTSPPPHRHGKKLPWTLMHPTSQETHWALPRHLDRVEGYSILGHNSTGQFTFISFLKLCNCLKANRHYISLLEI